MMRAILLILLALVIVSVIGLLESGCASGSLVRTRCTHVGLRAHGDELREWVGTAQVSTDWPACGEVYP